MLFATNPQELRQFYIDCWEKFKQGQPLNALEQQVAQVIFEHPEYHVIIENKDAVQAQYFPELGQTNPFLHMGLHLGIREQVATNRPQGIASIYKQLLQKIQDPLEVEHQMFEILVEQLWKSQRDQAPPDEAAYLLALQTLLIKS
jgi:hypothetical protein